jgi:hypothetical protein
LNPRPLGYEPEPYDMRLGQSQVTVMASADVRREVVPAFCVSPVSACSAAFGLQIGLQN